MPAEETTVQPAPEPAAEPEPAAPPTTESAEQPALEPAAEQTTAPPTTEETAEQPAPEPAAEPEPTAPPTAEEETTVQPALESAHVTEPDTDGETSEDEEFPALPPPHTPVKERAIDPLTEWFDADTYARYDWIRDVIKFGVSHEAIILMTRILVSALECHNDTYKGLHDPEDDLYCHQLEEDPSREIQRSYIQTFCLNKTVEYLRALKIMMHEYHMKIAQKYIERNKTRLGASRAAAHQPTEDLLLQTPPCPPAAIETPAPRRPAPTTAKTTTKTATPAKTPPSLEDFLAAKEKKSANKTKSKGKKKNRK